MLLVQAQAYRRQYGFNAIYLLPVNLYGQGDNFDSKSSHVIPALIRKFTEAKRNGINSVEVWGTGCASREFLYVNDAARGIVLATELFNGPEPVNLGAAMEITICDLANLIQRLSGFEGSINWNVNTPDGQPRRCLDVSHARESFEKQPSPVDAITKVSNKPVGRTTLAKKSDGTEIGGENVYAV